VYSDAECCAPCATGPGAAPWYTANATGYTFYLNTTEVDSAAAEESCKRNGGHLAAYISLEEQAEVEHFYTTKGYLMPKFHQIYWTGLRVTSGACTSGWHVPRACTASAGRPAACPGW
jgi:hypothetical protein